MVCHPIQHRRIVDEIIIHYAHVRRFKRSICANTSLELQCEWGMWRFPKKQKRLKLPESGSVVVQQKLRKHTSYNKKNCYAYYFLYFTIYFTICWMIRNEQNKSFSELLTVRFRSFFFIFVVFPTLALIFPVKEWFFSNWTFVWLLFCVFRKGFKKKLLEFHIKQQKTGLYCVVLCKTY